MADLDITITVPEAYIPRVQATFNGLAGMKMKLKNEVSGGVEFVIQPKQVGETNLQFGERFIRQAMRQFVRLFELDTDTDRYKTEVAAVVTPTETVPDDIIT